MQLYGHYDLSRHRKPESGAFLETGNFWQPESGSFVETGNFWQAESGAFVETGIADPGWDPTEADQWGVTYDEWLHKAAIKCPAGCTNVWAEGDYSVAEACWTADGFSPCGSANGNGVDTHAVVQKYIDQGLSLTDSILKYLKEGGNPENLPPSYQQAVGYQPSGFRWEYIALGAAGLVALFLVMGKKS